MKRCREVYFSGYNRAMCFIGNFDPPYTLHWLWLKYAFSFFIMSCLSFVAGWCVVVVPSETTWHRKFFNCPCDSFLISRMVAMTTIFNISMSTLKSNYSGLLSLGSWNCSCMFLPMSTLQFASDILYWFTTIYALSLLPLKLMEFYETEHACACRLPSVWHWIKCTWDSAPISKMVAQPSSKVWRAVPWSTSLVMLKLVTHLRVRLALRLLMKLISLWWLPW